MCFPKPDIKTPEIPIQQGAEESKSATFKQAAKRRGYQSTILAGEQEATTGKKRLLGE